MLAGLMKFQGVRHYGVFRMNATPVPLYSISTPAFRAVGNHSDENDSDTDSDCAGTKHRHERTWSFQQVSYQKECCQVGLLLPWKA